MYLYIFRKDFTLNTEYYTIYLCVDKLIAINESVKQNPSESNRTRLQPIFISVYQKLSEIFFPIATPKDLRIGCNSAIDEHNLEIGLEYARIGVHYFNLRFEGKNKFFSFIKDGDLLHLATKSLGYIGERKTPDTVTTRKYLFIAVIQKLAENVYPQYQVPGLMLWHNKNEQELESLVRKYITIIFETSGMEIHFNSNTIKFPGFEIQIF